MLILVFQYIQEKHKQDEILQNLKLKYHIMQNENFTNQLLTNKTLASDILKMLQQIKKPVSPLSEKNSCHRKEIISSKSMQNTGMRAILVTDCMIFHYSVKASKLITGF